MGLFGDSDAQGYLNQALMAYQNAVVPTVESGQINNLPLETTQGTVSPNQIQTAAQEPSAYTNISLDPATRQAQINALQAYQELANTGGLDAESKLALQQVIDQANTQSRGAQGAIQREAQAMGQGGGDFALTQRALAAQAASNNAANQGLQAATLAESNRQQALNAMANIGGNINAADWGQAAQTAQAQNQINAANQAAQNAANTQNVANQFGAQQFNVSNAQNVNAANTGSRQNQVYYNAGLPQQKFQNELAKAGGVAGVSAQQANAAQNAQNAGLGFAGSLLGTAGTIAGGMMGGPPGAIAGGMMGRQLGGGSPSSSMIGGGRSTPTGANANPARYGITAYSEGGYTCYADGGVAHDHAICMKLGGHVPGEAEVAGDSQENDTVPAMLSPGELVIPRSVPKTGPAMEEFARNAPVGGTDHKLDLTSFTSGYKRSR